MYAISLREVLERYLFSRALKVSLLPVLLTISYKLLVNTTVREKSSNCPQAKKEYQTLQARCEEHDRSLPAYPQPSLSDVKQEIIRLSSILEDPESHSALQQALQLPDHALEAAYEAELSSWTSRGATNWTTEKKRLGLLKPRKPLSTQCLATTLPKSGKDLLSTAASLMHAIGVIVTSPWIIRTIGTDGKQKQFETKQLAEVFATNRVPGTGIDSVRTFPESRHVVVWVRSRPYRVEIIDTQGQPVSERSLTAVLQRILEHSSSDKIQRANIASLSTSLDRDTWAQAREDIMRSDGPSMQTLESAISSIALELGPVCTEAERFHMTMADTGNVYSDKTMSWSVFADGGLSARVDHSVADGGFFGRLLEVFMAVMARSSQRTILGRFLGLLDWSSQPTIPAASGLEITFHTVDTARPDLSLAYQPQYKKQVSFFEITLNPNALSHLRKTKLLNLTVQLAFQASLIQALETTKLLILEPTSVRQFADGRSDPNFVITSESIAFCKALAFAQQDHTALLPLFKNATTRYLALQNQAKAGSSISAGIAFLGAGLRSVTPSAETPSAERIVLARSLGKISNPIYFTGSPSAPAHEYFEAYIFADDQLALVYVGQSERLLVSIAASGKFRALLPRVRELMVDYLGVVARVAGLAGEGEA
ncbi:uncharacterized protein DSM5745_09336 [Aspergillus mulundensis]|uniref:Choline/carnitine acyltransferase domain-containing protein n=1 Tax=Aspergillus mulundensis TaxID=1810919 RepID=A0A3D8R0L6_9EURO|nr:hypothetical protein DSM5745_09336 [Aspergillus mulundensis]RDW67470.1 hypothetical protein DSM5745_09336 [Aspergillus mulundensis]